MATNYNALIKSEKNLKKMVLEFLEYSFSTHEKLWTYIFSDIERYEILDSIQTRAKESKERERDLLDECIWTISKDDPRANHLRFIISIIYSGKDISKATDYSFSIIKTFVRKQISKEQIFMLKELVESYLKSFSIYIKMYKSEKIKDKFDETEKIYLEFLEISHDITKKIRKDLTELSNELDYFPISQIVKNIESTIECLKSVFVNTVFSRE